MLHSGGGRTADSGSQVWSKAIEIPETPGQQVEQRLC